MSCWLHERKKWLGKADSIRFLELLPRASPCNQGGGKMRRSSLRAAGKLLPLFYLLTLRAKIV
jgi:hypothetical protein